MKKRKKMIFLTITIILFSMSGCKKEIQKNSDSVKKEKQSNETQTSLILKYKEGETSLTNHPYNLFSYYNKGFTYIKKGNAICRIPDGTEEIQDIYTEPEAIGLGFTINNNEMYIYRMCAVGEEQKNRTEIIKMNLDGTSQVTLLTYDGITSGITFYQDNIYLHILDAEGDHYQGYQIELNNTLEEVKEDDSFLYHKVNVYFQDADNFDGSSNAVLDPAFSMEHYGGIFYCEHQKGELPVWDIHFEFGKNISNTIIECQKEALITPYGIFAISKDGNTIVRRSLDSEKEETVYTVTDMQGSMQLFTYDENGIYFCEYRSNGDGIIYSIDKENNLKKLFGLQELGITLNNQGFGNSELYFNVQNGYAYLWTDKTQTMVREKIQFI